MVFGTGAGVDQVHFFLVLPMLCTVSLTRMEIALCTFLWRERLEGTEDANNLVSFCPSGYNRHSIALGPRDAHRRQPRRSIDKRLRKGWRLSSKVRLATATLLLIMRP
jgi:hypothetical protein